MSTKTKMLFFLGWIALYLIVKVFVCAPPTGRSNNADYPELYTYQVGKSFCVVDFSKINAFIKKRGGQPLTPNNLRIIKTSAWSNVFDLFGIYIEGNHITVAGEYPFGGTLNLILYHEVLHWINSTKPRSEFIVSLFWNRGVSMIIIPLIFLFIIWPVLQKGFHKFSREAVILETLILFIILINVASRYIDPEEISAYCGSRNLWQNGAAPIVVIFDYQPNLETIGRDIQGKMIIVEKWTDINKERINAWEFRHEAINHVALIIKSLLKSLLIWFIFRNLLYFGEKDCWNKIKSNLIWASIIFAIIFAFQNGYDLFRYQISVNEKLPLRQAQVLYVPNPIQRSLPKK